MAPPSMNNHINDSEPYKPSMGKLEQAETNDNGETDLVTPPEGVTRQGNPKNRKGSRRSKESWSQKLVESEQNEPTQGELEETEIEKVAETDPGEPEEGVTLKDEPEN